MTLVWADCKDTRTTDCGVHADGNRRKQTPCGMRACRDGYVAVQNAAASILSGQSETAREVQSATACDVASFSRAGKERRGSSGVA
eukprot:4187190-Pleurochrysis_carterae.AAC.2